MNSKRLPEQAYIHLEPENQRWLDARVAWIVQEFGIEHIRQCPIALPNSPLLHEYRCTTDEEVFQFFARIAEGMGLDPARIDFALHSDWKNYTDNSSTLGTYQAIDGRFVVTVDESQLHDPPTVLAILVHELCHVQLMGHERVTGSEPDNEPLTDLLTIFMGYGIIAANSVVYDESSRLGTTYQYVVGRRGYLTMPMFGYALALLAKLRGEDGASWQRHMRPDVRDAFVKSLRFFDRHGLPDLSSPPQSFTAPPIRIETEAEPEKGLLQASAFYPDDCEPEEPEDDRDFDTEPAEAHQEAGATCTYCSAPVNSDDEVPICQACQESIDEGEQELSELRAIDEQNLRFQGALVKWALLFVVGFVLLLFLISKFVLP